MNSEVIMMWKLWKWFQWMFILVMCLMTKRNKKTSKEETINHRKYPCELNSRYDNQSIS